MKSLMKRIAALFAAVTVIAVCPVSAEASVLKTEDGIKYIQYDNGESKPYTGWTKKGDKRYYYKNGIMKKNCWLIYGGKRRSFLGKDGAAVVGKVTISGVEYEFDEKGCLIQDNMGISITTSDAVPTGLSYEITFERPAYDSTTSLITADGQHISVFCGDEYSLERYTSEGWQAVPYVSDPAEWNDLAYELCGKGSFTFKIRWDDIYGELESGQYRLCKNIYYWKDDGTWDKKLYYGYFRL